MKLTKHHVLTIASVLFLLTGSIINDVAWYWAVVLTLVNVIFVNIGWAMANG